jgi:hypothetical protein
VYVPAHLYPELLPNFTTSEENINTKWKQGYKHGTVNLHTQTLAKKIHIMPTEYAYNSTLELIKDSMKTSKLPSNEYGYKPQQLISAENVTT